MASAKRAATGSGSVIFSRPGRGDRERGKNVFGVRWPQPPLLYATERGPHPPKAAAAATALQSAAARSYVRTNFLNNPSNAASGSWFTPECMGDI